VLARAADLEGLGPPIYEEAQHLLRRRVMWLQSARYAATEGRGRLTARYAARYA
jgi:hypothetical protein